MLSSKKDGYINKTFEIPIFSSFEIELLSELELFLIEKKRKRVCLVFTPNPEMIVLSSKDKQFRQDLMSADFNIPDGIGLVLASKVLRLFKKGEPVMERIAGADLAMKLVARCNDLGLPVYLLGSSEQVNEKAVTLLRSKFKGLNVYGSSEPTNINSATESDWAKIVLDINKKKPGLLLVGYGQVKQERFLIEYRDQLEVKVAMGVGGTFDFWAGKIKRSPMLLRKLGLEWLWRVMMEPSRASRIYRATVEFGLVVLKKIFT